MTWHERGKQAYKAPFPDEALPDCMACEKPELPEEDLEVVNLFHRVVHQEQVNYVSGHLLGLRLEAVVEAIKWYTEAGEISDPQRVMNRIWILDAAYCAVHNRKIDAKSNKK